MKQDPVGDIDALGLQGACEEQLEQLKNHIVEKTRECDMVNDELTSFCYSVSHDLRAPLRSLNGFSQALLDDYDQQLDDVAKEYLQRIRNASQTMHEMIDKLLTLSRINQFEIKKETFNLSQLVEKINANLTRQYRDCSIDCVVQKDLEVCADKNLFSIVMENILSNAWKFTRNSDNARVEFGAKKNQSPVVFYLQDNGVGLDMRFAEKVFTPFQKVVSNNENVGGGIGLATVQRIIHRHNGKIWIESSPGEGFAVFFHLPG